MVLDPGALSRRRAHLAGGNLLRSLTEVIRQVPGGINLGQGVCDIDLPPALAAGVQDAVGAGDRQTYTPYGGLPELRAAIAAKLRDFNALDVEADHVIVTAGSSTAFYCACAALCDPGDEVVLFEPFYSYHLSQLRLLGLVPRFVPLEGPTLAFDPARLRALIGPRTRAVVVNTPGNPSGKVFERSELAAIAGVLDGTRTILLTDEVYEYMCFDGRRHLSPASLAELRDRTLTIGGFSKTYSITGWRIGYLAGPPAIADAIGRVFDQTNVCAARPMQRGVLRALHELPPAFYARLQQDYERRRDRLIAALRDAGFDAPAPQGAYYVLAGYRGSFGDIEPYPAVLQLIERAGINGVPGDLFWSAPEQVRTIRLHFAVPDPVLDEVCARLRRLRR
jgi:aminotransferase